MDERHAGDLATIALPDDAAELETFACITTQGRRLLTVKVGFFDRFMNDQLVPEVLAAEGARAGAGHAAQRILLHVQRLTALNPQLGTGFRQPHGHLLTLHTEALIQIQQHRRTISVENLAVECAHALELMRRVQLTTRLCQACIDHILHRLQLSASAEGADALDLISLDRKALRQVYGVEWDQVAFARRNHQA